MTSVIDNNPHSHFWLQHSLWDTMIYLEQLREASFVVDNFHTPTIRAHMMEFTTRMVEAFEAAPNTSIYAIQAYYELVLDISTNFEGDIHPEFQSIIVLARMQPD